MAEKWTLTELTELDLRLQQDSSVPVADLKNGELQTPTRSQVLRRWLQQGKTEHREAERLAALAVRSSAWLGLSVLLFSFIAGLSTAAALLTSTGDKLINVSSYLGVLVGLQLLLLAGLLLSRLLIRKRLNRLQAFFLPESVKRLPSPVSLNAWTWHLFAVFQRGGVAFNLGALLFTLWRGITFDLAFGWATTLQTTGERVFRMAQMLAAPWGGAFAPDLQDVIGSRIVFNQEWRMIDNSATASWWPFLMLCVLVYGLLPRLLLSLLGSFQFRRHLRHPSFNSPECERIFLASTRPGFSFSGGPASPSPSQEADRLAGALKPEKPLRLQVEDHLLDEQKKNRLSAALRQSYGIPIDPEATGVLKVVECWQPPLEETLRELRNLRNDIGAEEDILLLGVGYPAKEPERCFEAPDAEDLLNWKKRLAELNDPRLGIIPWTESHHAGS